MCGIFLYLSKIITGKDQKFINDAFQTIKHRGPDKSILKYYNKNVAMGFHRLAIMDPQKGMQPFENSRFKLICNGEIYNHLQIKKDLDYSPNTHSDCEVLLPLFTQICKNKQVTKYELTQFAHRLDGEFAIIIYELKTDKVYFVTDLLRVRPLFIGVDADSEKILAFASEQKALVALNKNLKIKAVPSSTIGIASLDELDMSSYHLFLHNQEYRNFKQACSKLNQTFNQNVLNKINSDRDVGFLLSGGLDSSLVCAIAAKLISPKNSPNKKRIKTFTVGFSKTAPDVVAAREVAKYIESIHEEIIVTHQDGLDIVREVIYYTETWDETTIRASVPMMLACKHIKKHHPEISVIYSGEVADELFRGYKYNYLAPSYKAATDDMIKRLRDIHMFDGLRADRVVSSQGMELRLPFYGKELLNLVFSFRKDFLDPKVTKYNPKGIEKNILRTAFDNYLPNIWRKKEAFSDATSDLIDATPSWKSALKEEAAKHIDKSRFEAFKDSNITCIEDMWYKDIFDSFGYTDCTKYKWLPSWSNVTDSSATSLNFV